MAEAAPAPLQVVVGSKNPVKLAAVRKAFFRAFPDRPLVCVGHDVPSGVPDQPWGRDGDAEGRAPARARSPAGGDGRRLRGRHRGRRRQRATAGLRSVAYVAIRRSRDLRNPSSTPRRSSCRREWRGYSAGRSRATANSSWAPRATWYLMRRTRSSKAAPWAP